MAVREQGSARTEGDTAFNRREWSIQRAAWAVMVLVLVAAAFGVFGRGAVSRATLRADGLVVSYERFARHGASEQLTVTVMPQEPRAAPAPAAELGQSRDRVRIWLSRQFVDDIEMVGVSPEVESSSASSERVTYEFLPPTATQPTVITFSFRPEGYWRKRLRVGVEGGPTVEARRFVYP